MTEFSDHELALMEKMSPEHRALMAKLSPRERQSMAQHVTLENIAVIESWIGTDDEIEAMLFWDSGGKSDDPEWKALKPADKATGALWESAWSRYGELRREAVGCQRRSDLTLYSQFNPGLLFTGLAGAVRCDKKGREDEAGAFFKGIEWRCVGSVEEHINSITIYPLDSGEYEVHFGGRSQDRAEGIWVYTGDSHSLLQLAQLSEKTIPKHGFTTAVQDAEGREISLDPRAIRKAAMGEGPKLRYGNELRLLASVTRENAEKAIEAAEALCRSFYERFGLETECYKIGKKYGNFFIMRDENFDRFLPAAPVQEKGLVLLTATLVCRRCRREMDEFRDLARSYPHIKAVLVNLSSPQFKFYERVFGDMGGGDVEHFRKTAAGVTPFIIIYAADEKGVLQFKEYISTGKAENTPSIREHVSRFERYFT